MGFFFFWEFGFVGKQKAKAYNLMQSDQKTRTGGVFFFFFWNLVLLKNRREENKAAIGRN